MARRAPGALKPSERFDLDTNTNTYFFREPEAIRVARDHLLQQVRGSKRRVSLWSAGCSTGDEPYSIAIEAREGMEAGASVDVRILATDVRRDVLEHAETGRYVPRNLRHVSMDRRQQWFSRDGTAFRLAAAVRELVTFRMHDLMTDPPPTPRWVGLDDETAWDVILCRNVLVYYGPERVAAALARMASVLRPDGLLVISGAEWLGTRIRSQLPEGQRLNVDEVGGVLVYRRLTGGSGPGRAPSSGPVVPMESTPSERGASKRRVTGSSRGSAVQMQEVDASGAGTAGVAQAQTNVGDGADPRREVDRLLDAGQDQKALALLARLAEIEPLACDVHLRIGLGRLRLGEPEAAAEALRRSLFLEPNLWPAAWLLGDVLQDVDPEAGRRYFHQAVAILEGAVQSPESIIRGLERMLPGRKVALEAARVRLQVLREQLDRDERGEKNAGGGA